MKSVVRALGLTLGVCVTSQVMAQADPVRSTSDADLAAQILARSYRYTEANEFTQVSYQTR